MSSRPDPDPEPPARSPPAGPRAPSALSANTRRAYSTALQRLDATLEGRPLTDAALAEYLTGLHAAGQAPTSIALVVAAVRFRARVQGTAAPVGPLTERAMAGIRREGRGRGRRQVRGITFAEADAAAAEAAASRDVAGLRDAALIAVASDALLRVSEVADLDVADIAHEDDGSGRLTIRTSTADPGGGVLYLGAPTMRRVRDWLDIAGHVDGPLFRSLRRGGHVQARRLTPNVIRLIIQRRAAAAGVEGNVSGDSLRIGAAQSLAAAGASLVELQTAGRWASSSIPGHYARGQLPAGSGVARLRYGQ